MTTTYSYFPGCSLKGTGRAYEESLRPVLRLLGVELEELDDWNCCGATVYMATDEVKACVMAARNLAIAERRGLAATVAPCSACYLVLNKTMHYLKESPAVHGAVQKALDEGGLKLTDGVAVRHPLDIVANDIGPDRIREHVKNPLKGLKVVPYYGCQVVRPYATFDDQYSPRTMDRILESIGCDLVEFPLKTRCCGSSLTGTLPEPGLLCAYILLKEAARRGADVIATACPLCQFNLDCFRDQMAAKWGDELIPDPAGTGGHVPVGDFLDIPVVYFTQLMGLSFGMPERKLGLHRGFVPLRRPRADAAPGSPCRCAS